MTAIEQLLRAEIGLDAASIGSPLIERTVRLRMNQCGLKRSEEYLARLRASRAELQDLIEAVVVAETWFYRDPAVFQALERLVKEAWLPAHPTRVLRILSVPCSTGEEPYTITMTLLDAGVPPERFEVSAVDISAQALARARHGLYGKNSFRSKHLEYRDRHFQASRDGYLLNDAPRRQVVFQQGNLLDDTCPALRENGLFDYIFCRNLLIYFDPLTQHRAVNKLERLLAPEGLCFVGAAEMPLALHNGFVSANLPMVFACRKAAAASDAPSPRRSTGGNGAIATATKPIRSRGPAQAGPARLTAPRPHSSRTAPATAPANDSLAEARKLADAGRFNEAATLCRACVEEHGPRADAYYLLGLVHDARGEADRAADCYRKVIYLDPQHYEALLQLALQKERSGDTEGGRVLRRRAQRAACAASTK